MTGMLASVNSLDEALIVLSERVDIIDLKQPTRGALGALDTQQVTQIVEEIAHACPVSATVGDLPMHAGIVADAVIEMAKTGVDYIKIGFFPGGDPLGTLHALSVLARDHALIAVLFADTAPDFKILLPALKAAGFKGVMLDTMDKTRGSLTQLLSKAGIEQFVFSAKAHQLLCGLAGSLRLSDISALVPYQADYLGFRGALCRQHQRTAGLDRLAIQQIRQALQNAHG